MSHILLGANIINDDGIGEDAHTTIYHGVTVHYCNAGIVGTGLTGFYGPVFGKPGVNFSGNSVHMILDYYYS